MISPTITRTTTTTTTNEIESIPCIDFSILKNNANDNKNGKEIISKEIKKACIEYGFFYILNHSIEQSLIDRLMELSKKFFSLPLDVKMKYKINIGESESNLGYFSLGQHGTDYKEGTFLNLETNINNIKNNNDNNTSELYPTKEEEELYDIVGFKDTCETLMKRLNQFSIELMGLIAISLNLPEDYFNGLYLNHPHFNLGLLKYMSFDDGVDSDDKTTKFGNEPHCDWGLFTLVYQDDVGGLQALSKSTGNWINVIPISGSFIFNIGDMLEIITKGYYISMFHQVIYNTSGRDRYSFPFFFNTQLDKPIIPINNLETTTTITKIGNYISPPATTTNEIESIPSIDFSILKNNGKDNKNGKEIISKEIKKSCKEYGFFYILNHGIEQSLIDRLMELSKKFFSLPLEVKMKTKINIGESESNLGYFSIDRRYTDYKEGTFLDLETNINNASNGISQLYPTKEEEELYDIVGFKDTCETFMKCLKQFSIELMGLIAISLDLPVDYFNESYLQNPNFNLGLLKYMSFDDGSDDKIKFGIKPHCDWNDIGGLQALSKSTGNWINVKPISGSFVFNIGDMLEIITRGYYISMFHQVTYNTSGRDRYSFPFFFNSQFDKPIIPINNLETTTTTPTPTSKIGNYVKDPDILNFKGTYNDYHIIQMKKSFNK
ncbi:hypothetical protein ACTFIW_013014 [Dictyostelium discoideum]